MRLKYKETIKGSECMVNKRLSQIQEGIYIKVNHVRKSGANILISLEGYPKVFDTPIATTEKICEALGLTADNIRIKGRKASQAYGRHIIAKILRDNCFAGSKQITWQEIGNRAGLDRHHATVIHSYNYISSLLDVDEDFREIYDGVCRYLLYGGEKVIDIYNDYTLAKKYKKNKKITYTPTKEKLAPKGVIDAYMAEVEKKGLKFCRETNLAQFVEKTA